MPTQINGLPAHVLLIHVIVVLIPLGAAFTVLSAIWPAAHRKLGFLSPLACLIALVFVPITTNAGEWLEDKLTANGPNPQIEKHADLGDTFLWFAIGLFVVSAAVWWLGRRYEFGLFGLSDTTDEADAVAGGGATATLTRASTATKQAVPTLVSVAVAVVAVAMAAASVWQLYRIGDSGAKAAWGYVQQLK